MAQAGLYQELLRSPDLFEDPAVYENLLKTCASYTDPGQLDSETIYLNLIQENQETAADAAEFLDSLSTQDMPPPPPPPPPASEPGTSVRRKKTAVPELSGLSRKRRAAEVPINERKQPEPGQSTLCGNSHNMAGCSGTNNTAGCSGTHNMPGCSGTHNNCDQPLQKKMRPLDKIMSTVPVVDDVEYTVIKWKDYDTGFAIRQNGVTVTVTTGMLNEMIRRNRNEK